MHGDTVSLSTPATTEYCNSRAFNSDYDAGNGSVRCQNGPAQWRRHGLVYRGGANDGGRGGAVPTFLVWVVAKERYKRRILGDAQLDDHIEQLSYQDPQVPILLIRSSGDEASGLLRGAQFVNWLAGLVMKIGGRQLYTLLCIGALVFLWMGYQNTDWMPDTILAFLNAALMGSAAIMVIMLIALSFSRISVGLDAWRWVGELETMVEDGPPGIKSELIVIQPRHPKHGLSHTGVYTEKETIDAIALWCKR